MGSVRGLRRCRRSERGSTLLPALGVTTVLLLGTTASLSLVSGESEAQGAARLERLAAFAAEAGLAEGREALTIRAGSATAYDGVLGTLPRAADVGTATDVWFDLLGDGADPWVAYPMVRGSGADVSLTDAELPPEVALAAQATVRYRVFVRDDWDQDAPGPVPQTFDSNGRVWLVAVGEVGLPSGRPVRVVLQQLVRNQPGVADAVMENNSQRGGSASKDFRGWGGRDIDLGTSVTLQSAPATP